MLNAFAAVLQFLMTWSGFIGVITGPIALICLAVAAFRPSFRSTGAQWSMVLLWPWHVYVWSVGIAMCFSAWGGWGLAILFGLAFFGLRGNAAWVGVIAAFVVGNPILGSYLLAVCIVLLAAKFFTVWLLTRLPETLVEQQAVASSE